MLARVLQPTCAWRSVCGVAWLGEFAHKLTALAQTSKADMEMKRQRDWPDREHQQWDRGVTRGYSSAWKAYGKGWGKHGREERRSRSRESNASWRVETQATTAAIAWKRPRRAETARDFTREITTEHSRNRSTSNQVRTPSASQSEEDRAQAAKKPSKKDCPNNRSKN